MKIIVLTTILSCCSGADQEGLKVFGIAENVPNGGLVIMERITETGNKPLDTAQVTNGKYALRITTPENAFYSLNFHNRQKITLILSGEETEVEVNVDGNDPRGYVEVSGSKATDYKNRMDKVVGSFQRELQILRGQQAASRRNNSSVQFQMVGKKIQELAISSEKKLKSLIAESIPTLAAYYGIQMIQWDNNFLFIDSVVSAMVAQLPDNYLVKDLTNKVNISRNLTIGAKAPEIKLPNPEGEMITLSSLKGNYVLIDFWAAWCRPCRAENPNVVRVYNQYANKNFEILGVSLDRTKNAWLQAIEQDGLPWLHISDLKYWQSQAALAYQVRTIPATYLIDPEGNIIAKNLRGKTLEAKLREIFG